MRKLDTYLYRNWRLAVAAVLAALLSLFFLFTLTGELGDVNERYDILDAFAGTILRMPYFLQILLPIALLAGTCVAITRMSCRRELIPIISAGMPPRRIAGMLLLHGWLPLTLLAVCNNELVVPWAQQMAVSLEQGHNNGRSTDKRWLRRDDSHILIGRVGSHAYMEDITFFFYDSLQPQKLDKVEHAEYAVHLDGNWQLFQITGTGTGEYDKPYEMAQRVLAVDIVPESFVADNNFDDVRPMPELIRHVVHIADSGNINAFWQRVSYPLLLALMLLLGIVMVRPESKNYAAVGKAIFLAAAYFMLQRISGHGALADILSPWLLAPVPLAALMMVIVVIYHTRRV